MNGPTNLPILPNCTWAHLVGKVNLILLGNFSTLGFSFSFHCFRNKKLKMQKKSDSIFYKLYSFHLNIMESHTHKDV